MVKKIIGCADVHIKNVDDLQVMMKTLDLFIDSVKKEAEEAGGGENIRAVIAGDLFEHKVTISNEAQMVAYKFLRSLQDICKTYVIAGNHDYIVDNTDKMDSITPIVSMANMENLVYLDKELDYDSGYVKDDNVVFHLFSSFSGFTPTDIEAAKVRYPEETHVGIIHADINGATTYTNFVTDRGLDPGMFEGLDFVIAGHIHKRQVIKKNGVPIVYCSSLRQKDFGEGITGHGYVVWNLEDDNSFEMVDLPIVKGYYQFDISSPDDVDNDLEILGNL